jgi:hypothetical protein
VDIQIHGAFLRAHRADQLSPVLPDQISLVSIKQIDPPERFLPDILTNLLHPGSFRLFSLPCHRTLSFTNTFRYDYNRFIVSKNITKAVTSRP